MEENNTEKNAKKTPSPNDKNTTDDAVTSPEPSPKKTDSPEKKTPKKQTKKDEVTRMQEENAQLKEEVERLQDRLLRNEAELQNFKRRMQEERIRDRKYATAELMKKLITPLDNFELGLDREREDGIINAHAKGFEMIRRDLLDALASEGLEAIEAVDKPFDPTKHQAVAKEKVDGKDSNIVIEMYQKGYIYKDRVLRPAMVKVSE